MYLIPQPQKMELCEGSFRLRYDHRISLDASCPMEALHDAEILAQEVREQTGLSLMIDRRAKNLHTGIVLRLMPNDIAESYTLDITASGVTITGGDESGLLYGVQTLRQILKQSAMVLPCLHIEDHPALPVRGLFYDATRCRIPTMEFMKELARKCSYYKYNQLHLYVEHIFLFDQFSEIWRDDTPLGPQDLLELDEYCRSLHIDLVPSIPTLGHLYKVLRSRSFHELSEIEEAPNAEFSFIQRMDHHTLNTTDPASLELVYDMIDQYISLFRSKYFNINGDEPFDLGRGRGADRAKEVGGSHQLYVEWIEKISRHVADLGKIPMFWGDVILADPSSMKIFPENIVCMNWDYSIGERSDHAEKLEATGVSQYLCPGVQGWKQTVNLFHNAYLNIKKMAVLAHQHHGTGLLVTEWGDFGHLQDPESSIPGIIYSGAMGWNAEIPTEEALNEAVSVLEYTDRSGKLMDILKTLSQQTVGDWGDLCEYLELKKGRVPGKTMEKFWSERLHRFDFKLDHWQEMNDTIDRCLDDIAALMPQMDAAARERMLSYFLMSDLTKLFNRTMTQAATTYLGKPVQTLEPSMAADLERWYLEYKKLWKKSSQEGELYRLGELFFWMADRIREGNI